METVFITIHDLSLDARIRYVSDSVEDILGYLPHEVRGKSCWEYFHPDQIPFARAIHGRGIQLDKAAVLNYCQIKHKDGSWVSCECVFTVVYDVLVASTSIYRRGPRSRQRALDAPGIRRIFSSSPRDPRYHMLSYISHKFRATISSLPHEPRAALFLNRFTRTSTIMFATDSVAQILGIKPDALVGQSFYFCIAEKCLKDAVHCLESAKANDSIAYLRFWYRDPTEGSSVIHDASMPDIESDEDDDVDGGVRIKTSISPEPVATGTATSNSNTKSSMHISHPQPQRQMQSDLAPRSEADISRSSSGNSADLDKERADPIFDAPMGRTNDSSASITPADEYGPQDIEIEAVVSCTSDGLVVVLRRARPMMPNPSSVGSSESESGVGSPLSQSHFENGLFASPWATHPVMPPGVRDVNMHVPLTNSLDSPDTEQAEPLDFLRAIREVAVFAWSLTGINGSLAQYGRGEAMGEALPVGGLPVWDPNSTTSEEEEEKWNGFMSGSHRRVPGSGVEKVFGRDNKEVELGDDSGWSTSGEEEILWKRVPNIPPIKKPKRRQRGEAFEGDGTVDEEGENRARKRNTLDRDVGGSGSGSGSGTGHGETDGGGQTGDGEMNLGGMIDGHEQK